MSQINARLVYRNAVRAMQAAGVNPKQAILSQSYLRLEVQASTSKTNYQFGVLVNDAPGGATQRPTEVRLNLQDAFYVGTVQMFTALGAASDTALDLKTYPNPRVFTTAGASAALYNLYNGYLSLTVNNRVITPNWDLYRHLEVNQTQQTVTPVATTIPLDQMSGAGSTAFSCEPNWVLIGSKNNVLQINLPSSIGTLTAATNTYIVLILRGILAQNVTVVS